MIHLSDKLIKVIKISFNTAFISIISFYLIKRAFALIPENGLFFFTSDAVENFLCLLIAYSCYFFVFKGKGVWKKTMLVTIFITLLIGLASLKDYRIHQTITLHETFEYFTKLLGQSLLFYSIIYFVNRIDFFSRYKKLENELSEVKEQLLRNQLHPHFLFNTFNSLYSMSLNNNPKTPDTILKLSRMMRYLTDDSVHKQVKLAHELKFIEEYIAIEKIRFGEQADINIQIDGSVEGKDIEPLLLITLVENAFKHGFYTNDKNAFVNINVIIKAEFLLFKVENSIQNQQHFNITNRKGKGLENLKKRLSISYPKKHNLILQDKNNVYLAQLKINQE